MDIGACIELGIIQRKQGLQGAVVALLHQEVPQLDALKGLFIQIDHTLVPYGIEQLSSQHHRATIKFQGVDSPTAAHDLKGCSIFAPQEAFPQLSDSSVQPERLIGYQVLDVQQGSLGIVQGIYDFPQQQLLGINYEEKELLVPYHEDIVMHVDHSQRSIQVQLPKGFIESAF